MFVEFVNWRGQCGGGGLAMIGILIQGLHIGGVIHLGQSSVAGIEPLEHFFGLEETGLIVGEGFSAEFPFCSNCIMVEIDLHHAH